jgi:hypothetical protein
MIPDEIMRRRIPTAYGYRIPRFEFIDKFDPLLFGVNDISNEIKDNKEVREDSDSPQRVPNDGEGFRKGENMVDKFDPPKLLPINYSLRIAADQSTIASDIRKYLASHHINPIRNTSVFPNDRAFRRLLF